MIPSFLLSASRIDMFLVISLLISCSKEVPVQKKDEPLAELEERRIGHTVTNTVHGYTYTCTYTGNHTVECSGPPIPGW